jgi:hypothetical protein
MDPELAIRMETNQAHATGQGKRHRCRLIWHKSCIEALARERGWVSPEEETVVTIRKEQAYDGVCTVFIGDEVVVTGLSSSDADALIAAYHRTQKRR